MAEKKKAHTKTAPEFAVKNMWICNFINELTPLCEKLYGSVIP